MFFEIRGSRSSEDPVYPRNWILRGSGSSEDPDHSRIRFIRGTGSAEDLDHSRIQIIRGSVSPEDPDHLRILITRGSRSSIAILAPPRLVREAGQGVSCRPGQVGVPADFPFCPQEHKAVNFPGNNNIFD